MTQVEASAAEPVRAQSGNMNAYIPRSGHWHGTCQGLTSYGVGRAKKSRLQSVCGVLSCDWVLCPKSVPYHSQCRMTQRYQVNDTAGLKTRTPVAYCAFK